MMFNNKCLIVWTAPSYSLEHHKTCLTLFENLAACSKILKMFDDVQEIVQSNLSITYVRIGIFVVCSKMAEGTGAICCDATQTTELILAYESQPCLCNTEIKEFT